MSSLNLEGWDIRVADVFHNSVPARLYEAALKYESGSVIIKGGALAVRSGERTGRSPSDKRIVRHDDSADDIWWGDINIDLDEKSFLINRERAIDYLNTRERLFVVDGYAGWDPQNRLKVRIICSRAYHALFMRNMMIRPSAEELADFGEPDFVIFNAGEFPANRHTRGMSSKTSVDFCFERGEAIILGTEYAGEMKKGIFTVMHYLMPRQGILSMHCSANEGEGGDTCLFFGLSGTGKTTLSADARRKLIGDDEHCWSDNGISNIEGGCYAKTIDLSAEQEPEIYQAIRYGALLENVVYDPVSRQVDYSDSSITENTRCAYPIEYIDNAKLPCVGGHPNNIVLLTCDAFGVLPPVSKLSPEQAMYHFISGYTAKVAGTEMGVTEPTATFSACFGAAFLVRHPAVYAKLLADKIREHGSNVWLVNTGWSGGAYGTGERMSLRHTRAIIDAIHDGSLEQEDYEQGELFGFQVPKACNNVPTEILKPENTWADKSAYQETAINLARLFQENFKQFEAESPDEICGAGPRL